MEILLNKNDLESMIKNYYSGVEEVKFNSANVRVTLCVDIKRFGQSDGKVRVYPEPSELVRPLGAQPISKDSIEEVNELAKQKGLMAVGGKERNLMRF